MTIPPRSGRWTKKSAQPPAGLEHYDFEGPHGLATPTRIGPWTTSEDYEEDHSPEAQEAQREFSQAYEEFDKIRSSVREEFGEDATSLWDHTPESRAKVQKINHAMDNIHPDLKHLVSSATESDPVIRVHEFMERYLQHTVGSTRCPRCIAHIVGDAISGMTELGPFDVGGYEWADDSSIQKVRNTVRSYPSTQEGERLWQLHRQRDVAQILKMFNKNVGELIDMARQNRGGSCPLHSGIKR